MMLEYVFRLCSKHKDVESVYLHVQINNETALNFYKKFGFEVKQLVEGYYKRIEPADAYVLEKDLVQCREQDDFSKIKIH
uniref:N-terminal methionine N(alpha)-acetyltransferase NatE n=1 Tax=Romanomermis culicivorax TaxID=13658 RepID=A0A915IAB0_ROMCU